MAIHRYDISTNTDQSHSVAKTVALGAGVTITFDDAHTAAETVIWNALTWAADAAPSGREYLIGGSATATATNFAAAVTAHADGDDYEVTSSGADVTIRRKDSTGTIGPVTGTAAVSGDVYNSAQIPSGVEATLIFDDAVASTKYLLFGAVRAMFRGLRRDGARAADPSGFSTSETTLE